MYKRPIVYEQLVRLARAACCLREWHENDGLDGEKNVCKKKKKKGRMNGNGQ